ncbi:MAG: hypothetical protein KDI56_11075 [Xanthomonadales bacterium]|nr:hypothetical protein [Xanthomonadales bacterium]
MRSFSSWGTALIGLWLAATAAAMAAEVDSPALTSRPVAVDRDRVFVGRMDFRVLQNEAPAGLVSVHASYNEQGQYVLHDRSESAALGIVEELLQVLEADGFRPLRSLVQGRINGSFIDLNWRWHTDTAAGDLESYHLASGRHRALQREVPMPTGTLTRASALYLIAALPLTADVPLTLNWFDSMSGSVVPIELSIEGTTTIEVPAGRFEVLTIRQRGGSPENLIYLSTEAPARVVRFDVVGAPIRLELLPAQVTTEAVP